MKRTLLLIVLLFAIGSLFAQADQPLNGNCPSDDIQKELLKDPAFWQKNKAIEHLYQNAIRNKIDGATEQILTIPVVVHVMHYAGQLIGTEENISMAQIELGIQHMNEAFANTGVYSGNANGISSTDPRISVNTDIQFCLAVQDPNGNPTDGVNRVATSLTVFNKDEAGTGCNGKKGGELKDLSRWDTDKYLNIWLVREICSNSGCGVAGYAYFPGAHGQCYDGAVVEARYFGSSSDNSKVHVHEIGHYLNLYHTFEGGCTNNDCLTNGDLICDTPPADGANYTPCSAPGNSCTTDADDASANNPFSSDVPDLIEDYMAYSFQSCQNTFTDDQKTRMRASLEATSAPRHQLLTSDGCTNTGAHLVYFYDDGLVLQESAGTSGPEPGDCRLYVDYEIPVRLYAASGADVTANFSSAGNGATQDVDFKLMDNTVTFAAGETAKTITLRVYNDNAPEALFEDFTLSISSNGASFNQTMTINIQNDDHLPVAGRPIVYQTDFSTAGSWTRYNVGSNQWFIGANGGSCFTDNSMYVTNDGGTSNTYTSETKDTWMITPVNALGYTGLQLEFDYIAGGDPDYGHILRKNPTNNNFYSSGNYQSAQCANGVQHGTYDFSSDFDNIEFDFGFGWHMDSGNSAVQPGFTVDNVVITADPTPLASTISSGAAYLGPNATAVFYNANGDLLAQINNSTNWDYGCTTVEVDNTGTSATQLANASEYFTSKTIKITPTTNNANGVYELKLFYTNDEVSGWETAANDVMANLSIMKTPSDMASADNTNTQAFETTRRAWDNDHSFSATINTGFSGFAIGNLAAAPLPLELANFNARAANNTVILDWETLSEKAFSHFLVQHSSNAQYFRTLQNIQAKGSANLTTSYRTVDSKPREGTNYYRLKMVDGDGTFTFSEIKSIEFIRSGITNIIPNPVNTNEFTVTYQSAKSNNDISLRVIDLFGRVVYHSTHTVQKGQNDILVPASDLPQGMYSLLLENGADSSVHRFWKR